MRRSLFITDVDSSAKAATGCLGAVNNPRPHFQLAHNEKPTRPPDHTNTQSAKTKCLWSATLCTVRLRLRRGQPCPRIDIDRIGAHLPVLQLRHPLLGRRLLGRSRPSRASLGRARLPRARLDFSHLAC
eukprot:scaffold7599_cov37-Phaeocystis_antarctica.AAC.1